ncbi:DUF3467 domain-containing protein [Candidatus Bathyarchaeota archaeon]|nr:DUF3467 domain-containing protein [Candidatus Bathyarchaeota archaeon]MBS7613582.1 DUF3467 domain-containing protein [Candidatus Bathyarchaeota archaeon]MBS7618826.1 DUF3467 domain-containing protein [Candidatus Bathyarchaeota archaeon]
MSEREEPKVEIVKDPNYRTIIVNGVIGGHRPGFFEVIIYSEEMIAEDTLATLRPEPSKIRVRRILQCRLIIDPVQAKSLAKWLIQHVLEYEKVFGKITTPDEAKPPSTRGLSV